MKNILIILFLLLSITVNARIRWVTPRGNDANTGADSSATGAWATWGKAFRTAVAGDTVYFRGGVYYVTSSTDYGRINNSGTIGNKKCFHAYPNDYVIGNYPILDFSRYQCDAWTYAIRTNGENHLEFKGLTIRYMAQYGGYLNALFIENSDDILIENMTAHHIGGPAFNIINTTNAIVKNCDAWEVCDTLNGNGAGMDGNGFAGAAKYYGCRAWNCSDWGFVVAGNAYSEYVNCWSFQNGRFYGEGGGIKYSMYYRTDTTVQLARTIRNCILAINAFMGAEPNNVGGSPFNGHYYNNFLYHNGYKEIMDPTLLGPYIGTGWWICSPASQYSDYYPPNEMFANNISYDNDNKLQFYNQGYYTHQYNSWDYPGGITITDDDFISLDTLQLWYPRKSDGSLPDITFGKLAPGSDLIDAGIPDIITRDYNIKLPFNGSAPDLGWFESSSGSTTPATPDYVSSVIENATPSRLDITYNLTLANIVTAASAFTVKVNTVTRTISSVAILGTRVLLTLANPVVYGDVVTVAYTKPVSNPLQTAAGGQAASLTAQNVTNNVAAINPVYVSSVIENATPSRLDITYNLTLANIVPAASAFTVKVNTVTRTISSVAISSGTRVLLTLANPVVYGDVVTVAYTKPVSNPLQTAAGGQAASLDDQNVTNNVAPVIPVYVNSVIEDATPSTLAITYDTPLANIVPPITAFTVRVNSSTRSVSSISVSGNKVLLILTTKVVYDDVVTVAYNVPAINPVQTSAGGRAATFTAKSVTNNCRLRDNLPPVASLLSPEKSSSFVAPATIVFNINAYDPDGSISKVEIFNGSAKLAEINTIPYSFTWKDVPAGTYTVTVVATDNLSSRTTSEALTIIVTNNTTSINQIPNISILSPLTSASISVPSTITITADATDSDGIINKVEFYIGDNKIGECYNPPYTVSYELSKAGTYEIKAVTTDNMNATAISSVTIYVNLSNLSDVINLYPNPNDGRFKTSMEPAPLGEENVIDVLNLQGKTVYKDILFRNEITKDYDLSFLDSGVYIIMISNNKIVYTKKFIKI